MTRANLRQLILGQVTEKQWQADVVDAARAFRWHVYHPYDSRRSEPGWPDLTLVREPRIVFAELKTERGKITRSQREWLDHLAACPAVEVHLWRPSQFDRVVEILR